MAQRQSKQGAQVWCAARSKPRPSSGSGTPQAPAPAPLAPRAPEPCVHLKTQPWVARLTGLQEETRKGFQVTLVDRATCITVRWPFSGPTPTTRATTFKARLKFPIYFHASSFTSVSLPPRQHLSSWPGHGTSTPTRPDLKAPHPRPGVQPQHQKLLWRLTSLLSNASPW